MGTKNCHMKEKTVDLKLRTCNRRRVAAGPSHPIALGPWKTVGLVTIHVASRTKKKHLLIRRLQGTFFKCLVGALILMRPRMA